MDRKSALAAIAEFEGKIGPSASAAATQLKPMLTDGLRALGLPVEVQTNMVFVRLPADKAGGMADHFRTRGVLVLPAPRMRLVTHLDVDAAGIERALAGFESYFRD